MTQLTDDNSGKHNNGAWPAVGAVLTVLLCLLYGAWARSPYFRSNWRHQRNVRIERQVYATQAKIQSLTRTIDEEKSAHGEVLLLRMQHYVKPGEHLLVIPSH